MNETRNGVTVKTFPDVSYGCLLIEHEGVSVLAVRMPWNELAETMGTAILNKAASDGWQYARAMLSAVAAFGQAYNPNGADK